MNEYEHPFEQPTPGVENTPCESDHTAPAAQPAAPTGPQPQASAPVRPTVSQPTYQAPPVYQTQATWQPQPSYTRPQAPKPPVRPAAKKKPGLRLGIVALCCALLGSVLGGGIVGLVMHTTYETTADTVTVQDSVTAPAEGNTTPTIAVVNNTGSTLTPAQVYKNNVAAVVGIANESTTYNIFGQASQSASSGSGFIISADGEILTNYHVVEGAQTLTVTLHDGSQYSARVLGYEEESDVALLKIEASGLPCVTLGNSDTLVVGDEVAAIGNPLGELTYSLTVGYVSSMDRDVNTDGNPINMMQIDAAINPGNSGGPLFRMDGTVIGINTAKYSGTTNSGTTIEGIGFAIPINDVLDILDDLRENGAVLNRAYMGVSVSTVEASEAMGTPAGVKVGSVTEGSAAEKAGLKAGDIITAVGSDTLTDLNGLTKCLKNYRGGDKALLTVFRNGETLTLRITFDSKSDATADQTQTATTPSTETPSEEDEWNFNPWSFIFP